MGMRKVLLVFSILLLVIASGCLFKPPAEVTFSIDKTAVAPGETLHIIVTVNNTGKVGLTGATLILNNPQFQIVQGPRFPEVLPVGKSVQLVWIVRAPTKPGYYSLKVSLELTDELKRTWTGFYDQFGITVTESEVPPNDLELNVTAPRVIRGRDTATINVTVRNLLTYPISIGGLKLDLLKGMRIVSAPTLPESLAGNETVEITYRVKVPYAYRDGYVSAVLNYIAGGVKKSVAKSVPMKVIWEPWNENESVLKEAYGPNYRWITQKYLADGYWAKKYNSTPVFNAGRLRSFTLKLINGSESEVQAADQIYDWIVRSYSFGDTTSTLEPGRILIQDRISYTEGQVLFTAMLRSIDVPARIVSLYNGTDCTIRPITEFYTADGWYIVDLRHHFIGSLDEYLASPYFPRIYQLVTRDGYRIVAQNPASLSGHEHLDVTAQFTANLEDRLLQAVSERLNPQLRSKLMVVLNNLNDEERLYALFVFSSAPSKDDLNRIFSEYSTDRIEQNVKTMYEFYRDMEWSDDFTRYWRIFAGEV
ncbi:transglutaminase domain-containing protein [Thermococcus sp.]|uniref:transglutaminase domain-containing protein n=1 Tax=Thermococcus sp. TaxID=35749 RepID=UPI0026022704|nr:transglutaminase domain-containing protein [Thermococcus sp.]